MGLPPANGAMMDDEAIERAAAYFGAARVRGEVIERPPAEIEPGDEGDAYRVQAALHRWLEANGQGRQTGYKIGCTTHVQQAHVGIPRPCGGGMRAAAVHEGGARLVHADYRRPGIECEIAVRMAADVPLAGTPYDRESIAPFVARAMAAAEIVDDRYRDYPSWPAPGLIADDFFNAGCVLGEARDAGSVDLTAMRGTTTVNGIEAGSGSGADVMGHPYAALAWLANVLAETGQGLRAGHVVLTGSVVQTQWPGPGTEIVCAYDPPFGELRIRLD